ncbi:acyltransferase [Laribacter hongkongensis]|uniref:acyltransferase family protein n=1 Tax=Laribacter hongkongensis TaxID=168471 RepID=UPI001EFC3F43|nr:acyltransferase family protein [Laribacter hongkongensis]MCG9023967.1 acyltransferase [Laribacter hongkongensis]
MGFRLDINGLRAIAVLAVVLFHFNIYGFSGGFSGVDVFFAISGYLMTGIIVSGLRKDGFSLARFYLFRAGRIIPALLLVTFCVLVFGWFWLPSVDYQTLGTHALWALFFVSNLRFAKESGYFDVGSHEKWLLHTWSLSVEWQFYLALPLVLMFLISRKKLSDKSVMLAMAACMFSSFLWSIVTVYSKPQSAFFMLPARAWEMLFGGLCWFVVAKEWIPERLHKPFAAAGLSMLAVSIFYIDDSFLWPGWWAIVPVVGTGLLLVADKAQFGFLLNPVFQWLGDRSYSIYLWHWPVVVFLLQVNRLDDFGVLAIAIIAVLFVSELTYRFVEQPARGMIKCISVKKSLFVLGQSVAAILILSGVARYGDFDGRLPPDVEVVAAESRNIDARVSSCAIETGTAWPDCQFGGEPVSAVVVGDSHASAVVTAIEKSLPNKSMGLRVWTHNGCPTVLGLKKDTSYHTADFDCQGFNEKVFAGLTSISSDVPVIVVNRTSFYLKGDHNGKKFKSVNLPFYISEENKIYTQKWLDEFESATEKTICEISERNPVYLVLPVPEMPVDVPRAMARQLIASQPVGVSISQADYFSRHNEARMMLGRVARKCGANILDPMEYLCDGIRCYGNAANQPIYMDDDHLSDSGNKKLIPMFEKIFG